MPENEKETRGFFTFVWDEVRVFFVAMFASVWGDFLKLMRPAVREVLLETDSIWSVSAKESEYALLSILSGMFNITPKEVKALFASQKPPFPLSMVYDVLLLITTLGTSMMQTAGVLNEDNIRNLLSKTTPRVPYSSLIINAAFVAPEKTEIIRDALKKEGYKDEYIDLLFISMYRLYDEDMCRTLFQRGVLTKDQTFSRMRELGFTDTRTKEVMQSWPVIPGPMDLLHMVAKEAFEPELIAKMGLADEFPEDQVHWLEKQGVSRDWALKYWYAHWDQPSIGHGFDMLHRGVIGLDELDMLFRTVEIPPYWRDKLTAIAHNPYTRVDVRRMHDMGVLNDDELLKSYMDLGYDTEKAGKMAEFTLRYNAEHERTLSLGQVIDAYMEHILPKKEALSELELMGYSESRAEFLLISAEYEEIRGYQKAAVGNIGDRYQNNLITKDQALSKLSALNIDGRRIEILIDKWALNIFEDKKVPSKTDLDKFLRNKIINLDRYRSEMYKLGYNKEYIGWYEGLVVKKKAG